MARTATSSRWISRVAASAPKLHAKVKARRVAVDILINNAGYGVFGDFVDQDVDREIDMLQLNVIALTELTHAFAADMARRGAGRILLVGSLGIPALAHVCRLRREQGLCAEFRRSPA